MIDGMGIDPTLGRKACREVLDKYLQLLEDCHASPYREGATALTLSPELVEGVSEALRQFLRAHTGEVQYLSPPEKKMSLSPGFTLKPGSIPQTPSMPTSAGNYS